MSARGPLLFAVMAGVLVLIGWGQSWTVALSIVNLCLVSAVMALGVNMQWGYAGLLNVGVMGFAALGGVAAVLVSMPPVGAAWAAGGWLILLAALVVAATAGGVAWLRRRLPPGRRRTAAIAAAVVAGYLLARAAFIPGADAIEGVDPALTGYLGGVGLPVILSWAAGGLFAAGAAWVIGRVALGLRSDYLAIATLGIAEIVIAILKNEDWLTRGVKNVTGLPRPVPYEVELQGAGWVAAFAERLGLDVAEAASILVRLGYAGLFLVVLGLILFLAERALASPWGRMMRAIRDNETAAEAMGKDVTGRHLEVFVLGSAVVGIAGAMLVTLDGQFTPGSYNPLRFTFLIWVMVIVGGSGNNWGSVFGAFLIWTVWIEAEPAGRWLLATLTAPLGEDSAVASHLMAGAPHMRMVLMGAILLVALRFSPRGLLPERTRTA
ncbi:MAG: branched-chain amino acid ABC transporter permease [Paracoccaceae bacterium]